MIDNLDKASLRRFDLKLEFNYLTSSQSWEMFVFYCKKLKFPKPSNDFKSSIQRLKSLTPGDFATVVRQDRFKPVFNIEDFIERLESEIAIKTKNNDNVIGFVQ